MNLGNKKLDKKDTLSMIEELQGKGLEPHPNVIKMLKNVDMVASFIVPKKNKLKRGN